MKPLHEALINHIKSGRVGFNLSHVFTFGLNTLGRLHELPEVHLRHDCNTLACIAGHLLLTHSPQTAKVIHTDSSNITSLELAVNIWEKTYPHADLVLFELGISDPEAWPTETPSLKQIEAFVKYCTGLYDEKGELREVPASPVTSKDEYCDEEAEDARERLEAVCTYAEEA